MEGLLLKWTNYLSGWQPRYFVLDSGILSYYDSPENVGRGSKGSIKMAVCEIQVNSSDDNRMDLIIPNEQCFYLRAQSATERQRWLVALGSAKACLGESATQRTEEVPSDRETLAIKLSELQIFCNLLMQQMAEVQLAVDPDGPCDSPDMEKVRAACCVLYGTSSQISSTVDDCIKYVNTNQIAQELPSPVSADVVIKIPKLQKVKQSDRNSATLSSHSVPESSRQAGGVTVLRKLEEMAMRSRVRVQQPSVSLNNITTSNARLC
ncbi:hypothetical protein GDO86_004452 [Hymenochirus boettgeri]|uniref:Sesquipedalian n=1 Tax=Hymenochirus boettgeri TaxID=247094 RepID=A0A8T2K9X0_9PIPI|nr:hypothetical protein GDO86_004452 [Hymenochirus boettgeri]